MPRRPAGALRSGARYQPVPLPASFPARRSRPQAVRQVRSRLAQPPEGRGLSREHHSHGGWRTGEAALGSTGGGRDGAGATSPCARRVCSACAGIVQGPLRLRLSGRRLLRASGAESVGEPWHVPEHPPSPLSPSGRVLLTSARGRGLHAQGPQSHRRQDKRGLLLSAHREAAIDRPARSIRLRFESLPAPAVNPRDRPSGDQKA
jgi:hypothetical protein